MKVIIAIKDRAIDAFAPAVTQLTRGEAMRNFKDETNDPNSKVNKHPTDYELWQLAEYDDVTGDIVPKKELLARAEDVKE